MATKQELEVENEKLKAELEELKSVGPGGMDALVEKLKTDVASLITERDQLLAEADDRHSRDKSSLDEALSKIEDLEALNKDLHVQLDELQDVTAQVDRETVEKATYAVVDGQHVSVLAVAGSRDMFEDWKRRNIPDGMKMLLVDLPA